MVFPLKYDKSGIPLLLLLLLLLDVTFVLLAAVVELELALELLPQAANVAAANVDTPAARRNFLNRNLFAEECF